MWLDYQNRGRHNDPLENCLAMGLRITDLEASKSYWKIRISKRARDIRSDIRNILTEARQVQNSVEAG